MPTASPIASDNSVIVQMTFEGDVASFTVEVATLLKSSLATLLDVDVSDITLQINSASVIVEVTIQTDSAAGASTAAGLLTYDAVEALASDVGLTLEAMSEPTCVARGYYIRSCAEGSNAAGLGAGVILGLILAAVALLAGIVLLICFYKNKSRIKVGPRIPEGRLVVEAKVVNARATSVSERSSDTSVSRTPTPE